jgi:hypothetical protein
MWKWIKWVLLGIIVLVVIILIWAIIYQKLNPGLNDPNLHTLSTGTQLRFESLDVGLSGIQDNSAVLVFHQDGANDSVRKTVFMGDKFAIYGYKIEIKAIEKAFNPSILIGASHGDVKFLIKK